MCMNMKNGYILHFYYKKKKAIDPTSFHQILSTHKELYIYWILQRLQKSDILFFLLMKLKIYLGNIKVNIAGS